MCGITGIVASNGVVDRNVLEAATRSLAHRGPDDSGTVIVRDGADEIGLGNRRLAILELSTLGHQPMQDPATGNWIVYNGEIFNFRELRQELEDAGVPFTSHCDTEVVLKAYGLWGEACLPRLRGMFAFAIWDARHRRLLLGRDPMGIKPLYFGTFGRYFLFASEVRTLLSTGLVPRKIDRAGLSNYLTFGSLYDPITLIEGIAALRPGHYRIWENGRTKEVCYWELTDSSDDRPSLKSDLELRLAINQAICGQMVSDVPVGVFLSGGIDSSSLVAVLAQNGMKAETFSIVFRESKYDEARFSRIVSQAFKTNHHEILVSQHDALEQVPSALSAMDLPTIDGINTYFVSEKTRAAGIKVALSGLGGDEIFAGYSTFRDVLRMQGFLHLWRYIPAKSALAAAFSLVRAGSDKSEKLFALLRENSRIVDPYFLARMLFTPDRRDSLLKPMSRVECERAENELQQNLKRARPLDDINRISYLECRCYMLNTLLRDADAMSMAHGLEIRVPLIDHQLARRVLALPGKRKMRSQTPKPLLLAGLESPLRAEIVHRRKQGFTLPFENWLRDEMREGVSKSLKAMGNGPLADLVHAEAAGEIWRAFVEGRTSWSRPWSLHVLQQWCIQHGVGI